MPTSPSSCFLPLLGQGFGPFAPLALDFQVVERGDQAEGPLVVGGRVLGVGPFHVSLTPSCALGSCLTPVCLRFLNCDMGLIINIV